MFKMISKILLSVMFFGLVGSLFAQRGMPDENVPAGTKLAGLAWYTDWKQALAEAKRSKRPIFLMAATSQCSGVPGVF